MKRTFKFPSRITSIVGSTDSGKSSLLRALKWVCLNQFNGPADSFIQWGESSTRVRVRFDDHVLTRRKGRENSYELDEKKFVAFGAGKVPEEVEQALKLTETNFQSQFDPHFWLSETSGQLSKELNQIINLSIIDESLTKIVSRVQRIKSEASVHQQLFDDAQKQQESLAWIDQAAASLKALEQIEHDRLDLTSKHHRLTEQLAKACHLSYQVQNKRSALALAGSAIGAGEELQSLDMKIFQLRAIIAQTQKAQRAIERSIPTLSSPEDVQHIESQVSLLRALIRKIERAEDAVKTSQSESETAEKKLLEEMGGVCPICNRLL